MTLNGTISAQRHLWTGKDKAMSGHSWHRQFQKGISQTLIPILHQGQMCCTVAKGVNTELGGRFQYSDLILSTTLEPDRYVVTRGKENCPYGAGRTLKKRVARRHQRGKQVQGAGWLVWLLPIGSSPSNLSGITRKNLLLWNRKEVSYEPEDEQWNTDPVES